MRIVGALAVFLFLCVGTGWAVTCDPSCLTCDGDTGACLTCDSTRWLSGNPGSAGTVCVTTCGSKVKDKPATYPDARCIVQCPPGYFAAADQVCQPCPLGGGCTACDPWSGFCLSCPAGKEISYTGCLDCEAGTYKSSAGPGACFYCPAGTYAPLPGAASCYYCPAGTYAYAGSTVCAMCPAGTFAGTTASAACTLCPAGTYAGTAGSTVCTPCPAGTYAGTPGSTVCALCPAGTFSDTTGSADCILCPLGTYTGSESSIDCTDCPPGTYAATSGSIECSSCVPGSYAAGSANTGCFLCPEGYVAPEPAADICAVCPVGGTSNQEHTACEAIPPEIAVTDAVAPPDDLAMDFGEIEAGQLSAPLSLTVANLSGGFLAVQDLTIGGTDAARFLLDLGDGGGGNCGDVPFTLDPLASCLAAVTFAPDAAGTYSAVLSVFSDDADEPRVDVELAGTGTPTPVPDILVTDGEVPSDDLTVPFGAALAGVATPPVLLTLSNTGTADLTVSSYALGGADAADFALDAGDGADGTCGDAPVVIPPEGSCTLSLAFLPSAAGERAAELTIASDDADEPSVTVTLTGTGLTPPTETDGGGGGCFLRTVGGER